MSLKKLSLAQERVVKTVESVSSSIPQEILQSPIHITLYLLRRRLRMTQQQLADRAGLPQSAIARLESGRYKPKIQTLEKIFSALFCNFVIVPVPKMSFEEIVKTQAQKAAKARLEYIKGTMSLEQQLPDSDTIKDLIRIEQEKLLQTESSEIWDF